MKQNFSDKNILIFGLGLNQGGVGSTRFFAKQGAQVRVTDLKTADQLQSSLEQLKEFPQIEYILGEHRNQDIDWADIVIKNPAVKLGNPYIEYAKSKNKQIEMDMGIFLQFIKSTQIIGVTGTKGKSTTSSLIYEILSHPDNANISSFKQVVFAGNIGKSVLETIEYVTDDTLVVLELSSFQLEAFNQHKVSPHWAVITNIFPDHLNYYASMDDYIAAKKVIARYQTSADYLFIGKDDPITDNSNFLAGLTANLVHFSQHDLPQDFNPILPGEHNLKNMAAALAISQIFGIDKQKTLSFLKNFNGIEFRSQLIKEWAGIKIYNDSAATNPGATIQGLKAFGSKTDNEEPNIILICGGMNKNMDYQELGRAISGYAKVVYFLEGDVVNLIIDAMTDRSIIEGRYNNLETLLIDLKQNITTNQYFKEGDIILFSPGATSFNLFQNEFDRGRKFNQAVETVLR